MDKDVKPTASACCLPSAIIAWYQIKETIQSIVILRPEDREYLFTKGYWNFKRFHTFKITLLSGKLYTCCVWYVPQQI